MNIFMNFVNFSLACVKVYLILSVICCTFLCNHFIKQKLRCSSILNVINCYYSASLKVQIELERLKRYGAS